MTDRNALWRRGPFESVCLAATVALVVVLPLIASRIGLDRPFLWTWLVAVLLTFVNAAFATSRTVRGLALVSFGVSISMLAGEAGFALYNMASRDETARQVITISKPGYYIDQPDMGYAVAQEIQVNVRRASTEREIYDVVYTISEGARVTKGNPKGDTWLFMGCSRTFGEGVNDDETLPSRVSAELGYSANVVNLGFHGYGPHQMLRALEIDRLPNVKPPVKHVIYQGIPQHVKRSAGRAIWDKYGPSYVLAGQTVSYAGPFRSRRWADLDYLAAKSDVVRFFLARWYFNPDASEKEIEVYTRIIERSAELAHRKLNADFTIVFWDHETEEARRVLARLEKTKLPILRVSSVIPRSEWQALTIPFEVHPTPEAYRRLASGVADYFGGHRGRSTPE